MDRRRTGTMLLVLAAIAIMTPRALSHGVAGQASALPLTHPPLIGDCLIPQSFSVVSCAEPHAWEVTARWLADDPMSATVATGEYCQRTAVDLVSSVAAPAVGTWSIATNLESALLSAPAGAGGWLACALRPATHETYLGSLTSVADIVDRPHVFGKCYEVALSDVTSCQLPHASELLATASGDFMDFFLHADRADNYLVPAETQARLTEQCDQLAAVLTDSIDPTRGGRLEIALSDSIVSFDSKYPTTRQYQASCVLRSASNRLLVDSLMGLGDAAVPFN